MDSSNWRIKRDSNNSPTSPQTPNGLLVNNRSGRAEDVSRNQRFFLGYPSSTSQNHIKSRGKSQYHDTLRKPINDDKAEKAIEEGRRLYVGNMPYEATTKDVEKLFEDLAHGIEAINMSVDPMTGRNPSYCFIDFKSEALASQVMNEYDGREFMRRQLKVKPGVKTGTGTGKYDLRPTQKKRDLPAAAERWTRLEDPEDQQDATKEGRRLYIGNLPRFQNYTIVNKMIRGLLKDFMVITVSKLISPVDVASDTSCYCFVDLAAHAEVDEAIKTLDGVRKFSSCPRPLKVSRAVGTSKKLGERRRLFWGGLPEFSDQVALVEAVREFFTGFEVISISKLFYPKEGTRAREGKNHCYCFVEIETEEETDRAMSELDWKDMWGGKVRVKPSTSVKLENRSSGGWMSRNFS